MGHATAAKATTSRPGESTDLTDQDRVEIATNALQAGATPEVAAYRAGLPIEDAEFLATLVAPKHDMLDTSPDSPTLPVHPNARPQFTPSSILGIPFQTVTQPEPALRVGIDSVRDLAALRKYIKAAEMHDPDHGPLDDGEVSRLKNYAFAAGCRLAAEMAQAACSMLSHPDIAPEHVVILTKVLDSIKGFGESSGMEAGNLPASNGNQAYGGTHSMNGTPMDWARNSKVPFAIAPVLIDPVASGTALEAEEVE